jgi:hypothetical protein
MSNVLKVSLQTTIYSLADRGWSQRRIASELGINRETVRRYLRLAKPAISIAGSEDEADRKPAISITGEQAEATQSKPAISFAHPRWLISATRGLRSLRWDLPAARLPAGILHAKVSLLLWTNAARMIVASANLTDDGYRRNPEVFGVLD